MITGDLASHFGCTVGLKDSVTAVVFVALGTSVPGECLSYSLHVHIDVLYIYFKILNIVFLDFLPASIKGLSLPTFGIEFRKGLHEHNISSSHCCNCRKSGRNALNVSEDGLARKNFFRDVSYIHTI